MKNNIELLAKSYIDNKSYYHTLEGHVYATSKSSIKIIELIGPEILHTFGITKYNLDDLKTCALISSLLHDIGKGNSQFQDLVRSKSFKKQAFRHEVISCYLILKNIDIFGIIFGENFKKFISIIIKSILAHHFKSQDIECCIPQTGSGDISVDVFEKEILNNIKNICNKREFNINDFEIDSCLDSINLNLIDDDVLSVLKDYLIEHELYKDENDDQDRRFSNIIRSLLITSDTISSALSFKVDNIEEWINSALNNNCTDDFISNIIKSKIKDNQLKQFQINISNCKSRVSALVAGCGNGKTIGEYGWIRKNAIGKKAIICYPTTGTTTQGYVDYLFDSSFDDTSLIHSRNKIDFEYLLNNENILENADLIKDKVDALNILDSKIITSTVDFVLGYLSNTRKSLFSFPFFSNCVFVFDEIHSYDNKMFNGLLDFIEEFKNAKILLVTASLSPNKLKKIQERLDKFGETIEVIKGDIEIETKQKYYISKKLYKIEMDGNGSLNKFENFIKNKISKNKKILIVLNTVSRCKEMYNIISGITNNVVCYHSRAKYKDNLKKQELIVMKMNESNPEHFIAVTTQVCEQSLDISGDILISEMCPAPSSIQRLGRNNRYFKSQYGECYFIYLNKKKTAPYNIQDFINFRKWLVRLPSEYCSQSDLADVLEQLDIDNNITTIQTQSKNNSIFTSKDTVRNAMRNISVIMESDLQYCYDKKYNCFTSGFQKYIIPMNPPNTINLKEKISYCFIASPKELTYSEVSGAEWIEKS